MENGLRVEPKNFAQQIQEQILAKTMSPDAELNFSRKKIAPKLLKCLLETNQKKFQTTSLFDKLEYDIENMNLINELYRVYYE